MIRSADDVTAAVLRELQRSPDPRFREIMASAVRHLHAWAREAHLTEAEFRKAAAIVARMGQMTDKSHNEVVLCAGSIGLSALVCLLNNGEGGTRETTANLLGPFWRANAPRMENGASIVRSRTKGEPLLVEAVVRDLDGNPVEGADVDVWHASADGLYENQDPTQADMNLRGIFTTDAQGKAWFRTVKPSGYPIPANGVAGDLLRAQGRHNLRPAHIHFLIHKPRYKTQFSQVYASDDPNLETDAQFGVTRALVADFVKREGAEGVEYAMSHVFTIEPGEAKLPEPPITGKAAI
ncbi:MAG: dioxygenase [Burkholderiales bacterium]